MAAKVTRKHGPEKLKQLINIAVFKGVLAWGELAAQRASLKAPVQTGRLARSITQGIPFGIQPYIWAILIGSNLVYARAHELGSGIHASDPSERELILIEAKNKKSLAFFWPGGTKDISAYDPESGKHFFKRVFHPGVPAHPYLRPAAHETKADGVRLVMTSIKAQLK